MIGGTVKTWRVAATDNKDLQYRREMIGLYGEGKDGGG